jgi:uroporphyrin-3 C-methyltransferase
MQKFVQTGEKVTRLETAVAQLQNQVNTSTLLQKQSNVVQTNYLLNLAHYNLRYQNDVRSAYYLLGMAVNSLNAGPNPAQYAPVTTHVQAALTQLALVPPIDEEKTIKILDELYVSIPTLQFNIYPSHHKPDWQAAQKQLEQGNTQLAWWQKGWAALQSLVIIRHHDTAVNPMLTSPQEQNLKANLQILVQQTEISVIQRNAKLIQKNILLLQLQLAEHFDLDNSQGKKVMDLMSQLAPVSHLVDNTHLNFALQELQLAQQSLLTAQGKVNV